MSLAVIFTGIAGVIAIIAAFLQNWEQQKDKDEFISLQKENIQKSNSIAAKNDQLVASSDELKRQSELYAKASETKANEILALSKRLEHANDEIIDLSNFIRNEITGGDAMPMVVPFLNVEVAPLDTDLIGLSLTNNEQFTIRDVILSVDDNDLLVRPERGNMIRRSTFRLPALVPNDRITSEAALVLKKTDPAKTFMVFVNWRAGQYTLFFRAVRDEFGGISFRIRTPEANDNKWAEKYKQKAKENGITLVSQEDSYK